ncbi:helicase [Endozoicomonas sp. SM1973]|uniref:Helicase n=1 Tax=Spartinivicinus marinus TaxID=2994442 RepID=A0A853HRF8_9GAMM|nr:helicase [Spartinivicinus marinus]MCX4026543.1 helicase [Spartinivicinus marinus]NYZ64380.1 helicase [Spartinivicinus marinus]
MKFRFLLWMMGFLMARASKKEQKMREKIADKQLSFQIKTRDGHVARHFIVSNGLIKSHAGECETPAFTLEFADPNTGFTTFTAANAQEAFMKAIQKQTLRITGDTKEVMWFQGLTKYWMPKGKKKQS